MTKKTASPQARQTAKEQAQKETPLERGIAILGLAIPQSVALAALYSLYLAPYHLGYGGRDLFTGILGGIREAVLGIPSAYGAALAEFPFFTALAAFGVLGFNTLYLSKRDATSLVVISGALFILGFALIYYQKFLV